MRPTEVPVIRVVSGHDPRYTTTDGSWTIRHITNNRWNVTRTQTGEALQPMSRFRTLAEARYMMARYFTRFAYDVPVGDRCAVCGTIREDTELGWWWHTQCRGPYDADGRRGALNVEEAEAAVPQAMGGRFL